MSVRLEAIKFNHDPGGNGTSALNIRRNGQVPQVVPEWQAGLTNSRGDSQAAYSIAKTLGKSLTIQARFTRTDPQLAAVEIRALDALQDEVFRVWLQSLLPLASAGPWGIGSGFWFAQDFFEIVNASLGAVLGEVQPRLVEFQQSGASGFVTFQLANGKLWDRGVGVYPQYWLWQFRRSAGELWTNFALSGHTIFVLLDTPTLPWIQQPFHPANNHLPWTEVMEVSCRWAWGAKTLDEAASLITRRVFELGPELIEYGCPILAPTQYATPEGYFNCSAFLERLRGGIGNGRYVNCTDCATIVSTFANSLGCDLSQSRMGMLAPFFSINPILAIGSSRWEPACGLPGFFYHEVAWKGDCTLEDPIFDACLMVDGDNDPTRSPHTPLLPANLRLGQAGEGAYRDRLAMPKDRDLCEARPETRHRKLIY